MRIALIYSLFREDTTGIYFNRALRQLGHEVIHLTSEDARFFHTPCDLYFRVDDSDYENPLPEKLHPSIYWVSDTHLKKSMEKIKRLVSSYDLVFCPMKVGVEALTKISSNVIWLPGGACDPEIHKRLFVERDLDIGFVGTDGGVPRKFYLQEIRERYPNSYLGFAHYRDMSKIYSRSKLGFSYAIRNETITMRCFEIMACGALLLANPPKDETLQVLGLRDREHLVVYHSPKELFELMSYYLEHKEEREKIAEAGYRSSTQRHTYKDRVVEMFRVLTKMNIIK